MKKIYLLFIGLVFLAGCEYNFLTASKKYNLRDIGPAGGLIFYINPNFKTDGWKYLEAGPEDLAGGSTMVWIAGGSTTTTANGNTMTAIGTGKSNTNAIIAQANQTSSAAKLCSDYSINGFNDWFLPSKDELWQMCWNLNGKQYNNVQNPDVPVGGVGNFITTWYYWSSSEANLSNAYYQRFDNGLADFTNKIDNAYVRPVRRF